MPRIQNVHIPAESKNLAINGALDFWQEKGGTTSTVNTASTINAYAADMLAYQSGGPTTKNYSVVRSTDVPSAVQSGLAATYSSLFTMITGIPSFAAADYVNPIWYKMEGLDFAEIHQKTATFGFWIKASIAGTYNFSLLGGAGRSYLTTFTVASANTWEYKSITVVMDTGGTWALDNTMALQVFIAGYSGSTSQSSNLNTWQSGTFLTATTSTNWMATSGATVRVSQLSIIEGSLGFGATGFQRSGTTVQQEFAMCQRYYEVGTMRFRAALTSGSIEGPMAFGVEKRATPSMSDDGPTETLINVSTRGFSAASTSAAFMISWIADARM